MKGAERDVEREMGGKFESLRGLGVWVWGRFIFLGGNGVYCGYVHGDESMRVFC